MRAFLLFCAVLVGTLWVDATMFGGQYARAVDTMLRVLAARYG
jgi:hypothetical protein